jgi:hypothetical protein
MAVSLGIGSQFALDGRWWIALACGLAGVLWAPRSRFGAKLRATVSLLFLTGVVGVGIILGYNSIGLLTNMVVTLVAWDLDHFSRDLQQFAMDQALEKGKMTMFNAHLKRLGIVVGLGWFLGVIALNIQISINFTVALVIGLLGLLSLLQVMRLFIQESRVENR